MKVDKWILGYLMRSSLLHTKAKKIPSAKCTYIYVMSINFAFFGNNHFEHLTQLKHYCPNFINNYSKPMKFKYLIAFVNSSMDNFKIRFPGLATIKETYQP